MSKAIPILILTTLLSLCAALWGWSEVSAARGERDDAIALQKATQARLEGIQKNLRRVSSDYATQELRLRQLHRTSPDRVTDRAVYDLLCERGKCAKLDPVPTPGD